LYHIYVNDVDIFALPPVSLAPGNYVVDAVYDRTSPYSVTLDQGWKESENQIIVVVYNGTIASGSLIQPQPGGTGVPFCIAKARAAAVPILDRRAYWLMGLGILRWAS
jgi:hypothetical protein